MMCLKKFVGGMELYDVSEEVCRRYGMYDVSEEVCRRYGIV